jgi:hypothetical protein
MDKKQVLKDMHKNIDSTFESTWNNYVNYQLLIKSKAEMIIYLHKKGDINSAKKLYDELLKTFDELRINPLIIGYDMGILFLDLQAEMNYYQKMIEKLAIT